MPILYTCVSFPLYSSPSLFLPLLPSYFSPSFSAPFFFLSPSSSSPSLLLLLAFPPSSPSFSPSSHLSSFPSSSPSPFFLPLPPLFLPPLFSQTPTPGIQVPISTPPAPAALQAQQKPPGMQPLISLMGTIIPQPPPLTGNVDPTKIEEIRRTVYVGNLNSNVSS